jgi:hypothetical protein
MCGLSSIIITDLHVGLEKGVWRYGDHVEYYSSSVMDGRLL